MISSVGPSFTGRIPAKPAKSAKRVVKTVSQISENTTKTKPKKSLGKEILDDMLYGLEMLADTFTLKF